MSRIKNELKEILSKLVSTNGVSGFEQEVVRTLVAMLQPFADSIEVDNFGNIYAVKNGSSPGPKLMIAAHSDEVGFIISQILHNGLLNFKPVGIISESILPANRVNVAGVTGVIGSIPAHLDSGKKDESCSAVCIDVGASSEEEVRSMGIDIGSPVSFVGDLTEMGRPDRLCGHALDNRVGCAVIVRLFQELTNMEFEGTVYGVITVQEETTMSGAMIAGNRVCPDCAIAVDTVPASDTDANSAAKFGIGKGPVIQLAEGVSAAYVGTIAHPGVKNSILKAAQSEKIQVQLAAEVTHWTTDGARIHTAGNGIPTGFVSVPRRYAHSPVEVLDINDAVDVVNLLKGVVKGLPQMDLKFI